MHTFFQNGQNLQDMLTTNYRFMKLCLKAGDIHMKCLSDVTWGGLWKTAREYYTCFLLDGMVCFRLRRFIYVVFLLFLQVQITPFFHLGLMARAVCFHKDTFIPLFSVGAPHLDGPKCVSIYSSPWSNFSSLIFPLCFWCLVLFDVSSHAYCFLFRGSLCCWLAQISHVGQNSSFIHTAWLNIHPPARSCS